MFILQLFVILYTRFFPGQKSDYSFGLVEKINIRKALQEEDWELFEQKMNKLAGEDLTRFIDGLIFSERYKAYITKYLEASTSEISILLRGCHEIETAWKLRSGFRAKHVKDKQWEGFFEYLEKAWNTLNHPFKSNAHQLEASSRLISVAMGYSEKDRMKEAFEECMNMDATHMGAHLNYFKAITPKWIGSKEELSAYVFAQEHPQISTLLRLMYFTEMYAEMADDFEEEHQAKGPFKAQYGEQIAELLGEMDIPAGNSHLSIHCKNHLVYLYNILDMKKQRNQLLEELGDRISLFPWAYFGMSNARDIRLYKRVNLL